jgi:glycosyltransferase involved in cell wall biosynthesis
LRELWGNAAVFVAPDDPGALATALRGLIFDPRRRRQLARDAMERAARFSAAEMGRSYVGLYQRLMAPAAAAASLAGVR